MSTIFVETERCTACGGTGRVNAFYFGIAPSCTACGGTGRRPKQHLQMGPVTGIGDSDLLRQIREWQEREREKIPPISDVQKGVPPTPRLGWICPVCGRGNAPSNPSCFCHAQKKAREEAEKKGETAQ